MNKEKTEKLYNSITNVKDEYIEEIAAAQGNKKIRRFKRLPLILAAVFLALALTGAGFVSAVYGDSMQNWFAHEWQMSTGENLSDEHAAVIDRLSQDIGVSQTVDGVTVTVVSAAIGKDRAVLLLRVQGVTGNKRKFYAFDRMEMTVSPENIGHGSSWTFEYQGTDGDGSMLMLLNYNFIINENVVAEHPEADVTLQLENLATSKGKPVVKGQWTLEFTLDYSNAIAVMELPDTDGFTDLKLSSMSLEFKCDGDGIDSEILVTDTYVVFKNGEITYSRTGEGHVMEDGRWIHIGHWTFPVILDDVVLVHIGETEIPVSRQSTADSP